MTRWCRSWPRVKRSQATSGPMCVTTGPLTVARHRRRCITPRVIAGTSIPPGIFSPSPVSYRQMPIAGTMSSTIRPVLKEPSRRHCAGPMQPGSSSNWRTRRGRNAPAISPVALEAVKRIDALFDIERNINGLSAEERLRVRQERSAPILAALEAWLREERSRLSRSASVAKPIDYVLRRWDRFVRFIDDGRVCLSNNAAERALRGFALGRKSWLFAGSERGADRAAAMATLIMTAKLNDIDPLAWLADVLGRIADIPQSRLPELLPWNWKHSNLRVAA